MTTVANPCNLCLTYSGRYQMKNQCCQVRYLAAMPKLHRQQHYESKVQELGKEAVNDLMLLVNQELKRKREYQAMRHGGSAAT